MNVKRLLEIRDEQKLQKKVNAVENVVKEAFESMFLDGDQRDRIISFFYFLLNTDAKKDYTSNNILINAGHYDRTVEFLRCFLAAARRILADSNAVEKITEEDYLSHSFETMPQARLLVLDGISDLTGEKWVAKAEEMENHPEKVCVAITSPEKYEECKNANSHLFYRVFAQRFTIEDNTIEDICCQVAVALGREGFDYTDEFANEIGEYITTVYPKADLKGEAFVEDMVGRVKKICYSKPEVSKVLDVDCVPYYNKMTEVKQPEESNDEQQIKADTSANDLLLKSAEKMVPSDSALVLEKVSYCTLNADTKVSDLEVVSQNAGDDMQLLVLALSTFPTSKKLKESEFGFHADGNITVVTGIYQLDPVLNLLKKQGKKFDCIIMLGTKETLEETVISACDYSGQVQTNVVNYFLTHHKDIAKKAFTDDSQFIFCNTDESNAIAIGLVVSLLREMSAKSHVQLFLISNGGYRALQIYIQAIVSLLRHENIEFVEAYEVKYTGEKGNSIAIDESIHIFNFVSGINEFINFGRMDSIEAYFSKNKSPENDEMITWIREISEGIQGGNVSLFEKGIQKLKSYYRLKKRPNDAYLRLFQQQIFNDYGQLISDSSDVRDTIRWCLKKGLMQQVLTLIESNVPELLLERNIWEITQNGREYIEQRKKNERYNEMLLMNDCINTSDIDFRWLKNCFNSSFKKEKETLEFTRDLNEILSKNHVTIENILENLQHIRERKNKSCPYEIKQPYVLAIHLSKDADSVFGAFLLLHKTLKGCRNEANHLQKRSSYQLQCVKKAIKVYLELLDMVLEMHEKKHDAISDTIIAEKLKKEVVKESASSNVQVDQIDTNETPKIIYTMHVETYKLKNGKEPGSLQGYIRDAERKIRAVIPRDSMYNKNGKEYEGKDIKVVFVEENNQIWQCEFAE